MKHIGKLARINQAKLTKGTEPAGKTGAPQDHKAKGGAAREAHSDEVAEEERSILKTAIRLSRAGMVVWGQIVGIILAYVVLGIASPWWLFGALVAGFLTLSFYASTRLLQSGQWSETVHQMALEITKIAQK